MTPSPIKPSPLPFSLPVSLTSPSINTKRSLLTCFVLAAYIAWSLGAWESFLISSGLRPKLRPVLLLAGDSLTERGTNPKINGWVTLLQNEFTRSANVVPRGLAGYNTRWYLKYAMPVIHGEIVSGTYSPALIMLWLGANDAALPTGSSSEQHVPITQYRDNLIRIVRQFQAMAPDARILLITPPHVDDMARHRRAMKNEGDKHGVADRTNEMAGNYAQWRRNNLLEDGLHLNTRGNKLMFDQLLDKIKAEFPDVMRKLERWQLPKFGTLVESDPWVPDDAHNTRSLRND
ncbi:hypothetical protein PF005_g6376 [Phytophthora fragariae]|uniref:SGNH hydrolase-type esterase domain-containing protein n=1 Tax=Phytophthora fragariae TaxID=53985 RepID=A0A6A4A6N9_9STRA|nr:hypothetical protein PF003_g27862 [Phytophthora fragariae]KAE8945590.1 hypothetical protein PF009_g4779 [Phytophthora fragariae]KAE9024723.1 hypothetical protein PF011_g3397 [Phytophthora fragariae]KAE9134479.1 hypothetical protein PF007_g2939 [Phytophthora fragariae]KAE9152602.1 hypothetical protein PF006_g3217 [Phytophthora fragariae]